VVNLWFIRIRELVSAQQLSRSNEISVTTDSSGPSVCSQKEWTAVTSSRPDASNMNENRVGSV
jgi:hypothetical protein